MGWQVRTTTIFILDHPAGFSFFDQKKEGIIFDVRRFCYEDINVSRDKAPLVMERLTTAARISTEPETFRCLQPFYVDEPGWLFGRRRKRQTFRPVVITTRSVGLMSRVRGISYLQSHPYYSHFLEKPVSLHKPPKVGTGAIVAA